MNFVGIDIGASGTRIVSQTARIAELPNNAVELDMGEEIKLVPYDDDLENSLEVEIVKNGESAIFPKHMIFGSLAERHSRSNIRPSVQLMKYRQDLSYVSIILGAAVSRLQFDSPEELTLYVDVPPIEIESAEKSFKKELIGEFTVTFPKYRGGKQVKLNIVNLKCVEEAVMSMVSHLFNMNGTLKEGSSDFLTGNVLAMNIGASTTDLAIVVNGRYLEKSGKTIPVGGNLATDLLITKVNDLYGFEMPLKTAAQAMAEGRMVLGSGFADVSSLVSESKDRLAEEIIGRMEFYFKSIGIPIQTVKGINVSGGGSLSSKYMDGDKLVTTSPPMSDFVTARLKNWCPNINVVPYGDEARMADIKGTYIRAIVDSVRESSNNVNNQEFKI